MNLDTAIHSTQALEPASLLQQLALAIDTSADEYNELVDAYEAQEAQLNTAQLTVALQQKQIEDLQQQIGQVQELQAQLDALREKGQKVDQLQDQVQALREGNKVLMDALREKGQKVDQLQDQVQALREGNKVLMDERKKTAEDLRKAVTAFDVAYDKSVKGAARIKELESELKGIKQHGDPKKLIAANKTLRDRNTELTKQNETLRQQATKATKEMESLMEKAAPSLIEPSYSKDGENIYLHPQPLRMERDGQIMTLIALTWWSSTGIGRVVTWDGNKGIPHFASVGHKTVDAKLRPSQEALDWVCDWFKKSVQTVGDKQTFKTKYQIKGAKK